ncbi:MAG: class I SAM-dependent methyltransferase [Patescibacteria group bacterium]
MQINHYQTLYDSEKTHWWYRVRREFVHKLINEYFAGRNDLSILDVGCGTGALMKELEVYGEVFGVDFSEQAVDFCKSRGIKNIKRSIMEELLHEDKTFDLVLALDVLEHIPDDKKGLSEIYRVLKPGGVVIIFVPAFSFLWGVTDVVSQHFRRYTKPEIIRAAESTNFKVLYSSYFNFLLFPPILLARFITNLFRLKISSENHTGSGLLNSMLYFIFRSELFLLNFVTFPFGVSCVVVAKK